MTKEQKKIIELISEIDDLCEEASSDYVLTGDTLLYGFCTGMPYCLSHSADILMTEEAFARFKDGFKKHMPERRELFRKGRSALYIATDTTAFNVLESEIDKPCGMFVEIEILAREKGKKGICASYNFEYKKRIVEGISDNYLSGNETIRLGDRRFPAPTYTLTFLHRLYGNDPVACEEGYRVGNYCPDDKLWIVDTDIPYKEFIENLHFTEEDRQRILKEKKSIDRSTADGKEDRRIAREDWYTVLQTDARVRLTKQYTPLKEEIIHMYEAGDFDSLEEVLADYTAELKVLKNWSRSVSFDNDILKIYIALLEHNKSFDEAERILKQLPLSHFEKNGTDVL